MAFCPGAVGIRGAVLRVSARHRPRARAVAVRSRGAHVGRHLASAAIHDPASRPEHRPHVGRRTAGGVRHKQTRVPGPSTAGRTAHGPLRAADGRRGYGVPHAAAIGVGRHPGRHPPGPRLLQPRGRRARGRGVVGASRRSLRAGGPDPGRGSVDGLPHGDLAAPSTRRPGGQRARVPVPLHLGRRRARARRPDHDHARGRDLPPYGLALRPLGRRDVVRAAGRGRARRAARRGPTPASSHRAPAARSSRNLTASRRLDARSRPCRARRSRGRARRRAAALPSAPVAARRRRLGTGLVARAGCRRHDHAGRCRVGVGARVPRVRRGSGRDRRGGRRPRGVCHRLRRAPRGRARPSSCCRSGRAR